VWSSINRTLIEDYLVKEMKALMGELAKKVRKDKQGREALRRFLSTSEEEMDIQLSNGKRYRVSRHNPEEQNSQPA